MKTLLKTALLAGAAWGAIATCASAEGAAPPPPSSDSTAQVSEVTVTARRREEIAKDVPIADTAYSAAKLDQLGTRTITDLEWTTPNLTLQVSRGTSSTLTAFIRGFGQQDPLWGFEPGVGLYVDDVYIQRPQAAVLDVFDVKSIEVLRGPQGTLYGRNTIGGAIKYTTAPIGDHWEVSAREQIGTYNEYDEIISAKAPIGQYFAAGIGFARYDRAGYGHNLFTGVDQDDKHLTSGRLTFEFRPSDSVFVRLNFDKTEDESHPYHGHREMSYLGWNPPPGKYDTYAGSGDKNHVVSEGESLLAQWRINDNWTAKSITAYRDGRTDTTIDFDETPNAWLDIPGRYRDHQFTQELQFLNSGPRLNGVSGIFFLDTTAAGAFDTVLGQAGLTILTDGYVITHSLSAYTNQQYAVTDKLTLEAGLRWTDDRKTGHVFRENYLGIRSPMFGNPSAIPIQNRTNYTHTNDFVDMSPRLSATYKFTPDITGYVTWSKGFQSGGYDMRGDAIAYPATVKGYRPEYVTSTEVGLKGYLFDRHLNFATDVFQADLKDQQITTQYPSGATVASVVDNVGASRARGWEGEGSLIVTPNLVLNATAAYIDAKYLKWAAFIPAPGCGCFVDVANQRFFQNTPKWTGSISGTYTFDLADNGRIHITPSAAYRGPYHIFEQPIPLLDQKTGYWLYNLDLVWNDPTNRFEVAIHGKNLSDVRYHTGGYNFPGALFANSVDGFYGPPRTWMLTLGAKFD